MSLDKKFEEFAQKKKEEKTSTIRETIDSAQRFLIFNRDKIDLGYSVAKSLTSFAIHKTPFALVEGAVDVLKTYVFDKSFYANDFFSEPNGWKPLSYDGMSFEGIFSTVLKKFPAQSLKFEYDNSSSARLIILPFGKLGVITNHIDQIFYEFNEVKVEDVLDFLVGEKIRELNTNVISVGVGNGHGDRGLSLIPEIIFPITSERADKYTSYIQKCDSLDINRALIFYGPPGTGKTTLCQTIVKNLGYRTLKFRYTDAYDFTLFAFIVRKFKIEAVIIDDFDQMGGHHDLFEFLEMLKKETKLVIALVNSLREFHPAILRPGRFDEIVEIDSLDRNVVEKLLGPKLSKTYITKVQKWPVAYINELVTRSKLLNAADLKKAADELDKRVESAKSLLE